MNNVYPIGTALTFVWRFMAPDNRPFVFDPTGQTLRLRYYSGRGTKDVSNFIVTPEGDGVTWTITRDEEFFAGKYSLVLDVIDGDRPIGQFHYKDAFTLYRASPNVLHSQQGEDGTTVSLLSVGEFYLFAPDGVRGKSAYEIAREHGYTGTEEEWLNDPVNGIKGNGIKSFAQTTTSEESEGENVVTVKLNDGSVAYVKIKNGARGNSGYQGAAEELEVVNSLDADDPDEDAAKALSAYQGYVLNNKIGENIFSIEKNEARFQSTRNVFSKDGVVSGLISATGAVVQSEGYYTTDFLPVKASTLYGISLSSAFRRVDVVAYYNNGDFISRDTGIIRTFTTPATCTHIRFSCESMYVDGVVGDWCVSENGASSYIPNKMLDDVATELDYDVKRLNYVTFGMSKYLDNADFYNLVITATNIWDSNTGARIFFLPVEEGQVVRLTNNNPIASSYAFLKSDRIILSNSPEFDYKYNQVVDETDGSITWEVVTDEHGDPVLDERRMLARGASVVETIPPETKFLYITAITPVGGVPMDSLPVYISIDGVVYNDLTTDGEAASEEYETIFFDDFNAPLNTNTWIRHTATPSAGGRYKSRFKTDENNAYTDQGCLVLKCSKTATAADGVYEDHNGDWQPIEYIASYISSGDSFACMEGRISARMKCSKGIEDGIFPSCFWTFGQNNVWPTAHEMDIAETSASISTTDKTASDGTLIPAGSHVSALATHLHVHSQDVEDVFKEKPIWINWTLYQNGVPTGDSLDYIKRANLSDWHVYSVEWNKDSIVYSIDDTPLVSYSAAELGAIDADGNTGFYYPQDLRFNIKATEATIDQDCYLFVDWVKAESKGMTPCTSISHDDVTLAINAGVYIQPTFNDGCSNHAFTIDIGETGLYTGISQDGTKLIHPNDGEVTAQANTIYMMDNGDLYVIDDSVLKKCDMNGNILSEGGEPLTNYIFGYHLDNGVVSYRKYNSPTAVQTQHRIVGTHAGTTEVTLMSANKRTSCGFVIEVV